MPQVETEFIEYPNVESILNYLNTNEKPKQMGLGYCICGQFIGELICLKPNPIFASQILYRTPVDHANVLKLFSISNDIYVIETSCTIYIVSFKPLAYSLDKPAINKVSEVVIISPVEKNKTILVKSITSITNNIYLITTDEYEQYLLLSYQ